MNMLKGKPLGIYANVQVQWRKIALYFLVKIEDKTSLAVAALAKQTYATQLGKMQQPF